MISAQYGGNLCPHLRTRRKTSSVSWERKRLDGLAVPLPRRGVPIRHIGHGWDRQRRSFNSCINKVGDRYATKLTGGFLAADLDICNADVPFKTETIVRSENANERRNGVRRREIVLRDARFEQRTRLSQRGDRVSLASLPKSGHDRQHHERREKKLGGAAGRRWCEHGSHRMPNGLRCTNVRV